MTNTYGTSRVLEPKFVMPASAWRLDNSRNIRPDEMRVSLDRVLLEGTSFKQITGEAGGDPKRVKQTIIDIVIRRGKLHNPVTDTGGVLCGRVEAMGDEYDNRAGLKVGDTVIVNASLSSLPMHLEDIDDIDWVFNQFTAKGYVICHSGIPMVKVDDTIPVRALLFALDESGTLAKLNRLLDGKKHFLIVGNNMISNILYGYVIRRSLMDECEITCALDKRTASRLTGEGIERLSAFVFDEIHLIDIMKPIECVKQLGESAYDLSVNCAEAPGAETLNILATKNGGTVLFANLINNLNIALYLTESMSKELTVLRI